MILEERHRKKWNKDSKLTTLPKKKKDGANRANSPLAPAIQSLVETCAPVPNSSPQASVSVRPSGPRVSRSLKGGLTGRRVGNGKERAMRRVSNFLMELEEDESWFRK
jgi:hypothetical protein